MFKRFSKRTKLFVISISVISLAIIALGIVSPIVINNDVQNWRKILIDKNDSIENLFHQTIDKKSSQLLNTKTNLKNELRILASQDIENFKAVFEILTSKKFNSYSIQIYDPGTRIFAWNSEPVFLETEIMKFDSTLDQTFFSHHKLVTFLSVGDTLLIGKSLFRIIISYPVEKHYSFAGEDKSVTNIADSLSQQIGTAVKIDYSPIAERSKDGRKHSFALLNNYKNKIGVASFDKPALDSYASDMQKLFKDIQSILIVVMLLLTGIWAMPFLKKIKHRVNRLIILTVYFLLVRVIIFILGIPSNFIHNSLTDATNFSSIFAFGMVRSPLEFTITAFPVLVVILIGFKYVIRYYKDEVFDAKNNLIRKIISIIVIIPFYLLCLRGLGASIRSVVFDSTIRYFKVFSLLPEMPVFVMELNILLLSFGVLIMSVILLIILFKAFFNGSERKNKVLFVSGFILLQICGWLMDLVQSEPQGTPLIRVMFITISFVLAYRILFGRVYKTLHLVYYMFASSIIAVALLSYYNSEIERESLKTTAHELTRTNENVVEFMVFQTLNQSLHEEVLNSIYERKDLSPKAFELWLNSLLYRESVRSAIQFYDSEKYFIGGFQTTKDLSPEYSQPYLDQVKDSLLTFKRANLFGDEITLTCLAPIKKEKELLGFVVVSAIYDEDYFNFSYLPEFIIPPKAGISSSLDLTKIKIYDFHDNEFVRYYGDVTLSKDEQSNILNADYSKNDEAWIRMNINNEPNLVYSLSLNTPEKKKILAVTLEEKTYSWNLSNFFKIFFVHTLIILLFVFVYLISRVKSLVGYLSSYRSRLILAFLVVSVIPMILIAVYFRDLTEEKNSDLIEKRLDDFTQQVESYLNLYTTESSLNFDAVCLKAVDDLGVNFSIYKEEKLIFSPEQNYVDAGLLPTVINATAFKDCFLGKNQKLFMHEPFEGKKINSNYSKIKIAGNVYIININDLFNKITIPISDVELDFFLFGIFSLAVMLLVLFSTFLAEQISSPIQRLTLATRSVATGDLNVEVKYNSKGEIKDLVDGFNQMVMQIKHSQANIARLERETAWKEMAKQVAHEIKNPLTPMKLSVQQLIAAYNDKSPKFDVVFEKVTSMIISQIEILKNIASEFSSFARMPRINIVKLNIVDSVQEAINLFEDEKKSIRFIHQDKDVLVNADEDQLKRTMINMIRNSIQARANSITVRLEVKGRLCAIRITDDGGGIGKEFVDKVFDDNFTTKQSGMGLGLSMAKRYIESIDGSITVEKSTTEGTTFLITLPIAD
jgi:nitrogen fixation/metabolism regulation signal transduction histidine kinase